MVPKATKKIGVKDIAAKAGVSIGTVDRVLHNRGDVKEETRKRVLSIVSELGYQPNLQAKSLSSKKTTRIAIVIPDSSDNNPYWEKPVEGIRMAAEELIAYNTEVIYVHFDASQEESFRAVLDEVCAQQPDGLVLNPVFKSASLEFIRNFDEREIPYVFIDVNLEDVKNLGYFGQDAEHSGRVAAQLLHSVSPSPPNILIVKQANKKVFSEHIEARIRGFLAYIDELQESDRINTHIIEVDLLEDGEPGKSISKLFKKECFGGIFVPNSRAFKLLDHMSSTGAVIPWVIGYDLLDRNVEHMKQGNLHYLLSQKPEVQAYNAIYALFNHLVSRKEVKKTNYSPIDILIKENLDYYVG